MGGVLHTTSMSNIGERRRFSKTVFPAKEISFQSRVEKSNKVEGMPESGRYSARH